MKLKLYEKVINPGLGECYLIKQKEEKYLFFVPNNFEKYVITRVRKKRQLWILWK